MLSRSDQVKEAVCRAIEREREGLNALRAPESLTLVIKFDRKLDQPATVLLRTESACPV